jgi:hypothetical protein
MTIATPSEQFIVNLAIVAERRDEKPVSLDEMKKMLKKDGIL